MGQFSHPNVVKLYGLVTVGDPVRDVLHQRGLFFPFLSWHWVCYGYF